MAHAGCTPSSSIAASLFSTLETEVIARTTLKTKH